MQGKAEGRKEKVSYRFFFVFKEGEFKVNIVKVKNAKKGLF